MDDMMLCSSLKNMHSPLARSSKGGGDEENDKPDNSKLRACLLIASSG